MGRRWRVVLAGSVAASLLGGAAAAGPPCCASEHTHRRAGCPQWVAWWAAPSDTGKYVGYYVGGGAPCRGEDRHRDDGTWGWDYGGCLLPSRVMLKWFHGRKYQGGQGAYKTDGPRCPPHEQHEE